MSIRYGFIALGLGIAMGGFANPAFGQSEAKVVAEIAGQKVTAQELEDKQSGKLLQAKYKYYIAERDALRAIYWRQSSGVAG